ncbi:MAG: hypothetical protein R3C01_02970 [Planctomycetaceae bacterium]
MNPEQIFIGGVTAALCAAGIVKRTWILTETTKGQRLVRRWGESRAAMFTLIVCLTGLLFGLALAIGLLNPIRW